MTRASRLACLVAAWFALASIACQASVVSSRVAADPYAGVDWQGDIRLKAQFHDHVVTDAQKIAAYDRAGYDVVSLLHYSGAPHVGVAWTERHWPPEDWLPQKLLASLENIRFFIPGAEEVAQQHIISPFLTQYIEFWYPASTREKQPYHYETTNEAIKLIGSLGGLAILAHPLDCCRHLAGYHATEIYSAHPAYQFWIGKEPTDGNASMLAFWDEKLLANPTLYGVAVNDWYGPGHPEFLLSFSPTIMDSGKTIVISHEATPASFRQAVDVGAMFAVKDIGETKDQFPHIQSISVNADVITIDTTDRVTWISNGQVVGSGTLFDTSLLPPSARYLRAEIQNADGSTVYTQPWAIEPSRKRGVLLAGDADQDLDFDQLDLVQVHVSAKYLTGQTATWGQGDWNGAPGGQVGNPPAGDGRFNQLDIVAAQQAGTYRTGPYAAVRPNGQTGDGQTSVVYNSATGELAVDAAAGADLTSINIDSAEGIFTGSSAQNLGSSFDNDADNNIFKATFGSSFGSLSFGNVAQAGLSEQFLLGDLTVVGSLAGGGGLGDVDLVYVPEPTTLVLLSLGLLSIGGAAGYELRRRRWWSRP